MSAQKKTKRQTAASITARKGGEPIVGLTAYDAPTAALLDPHCDLILVGDSVGMVVHGLPSTVGVTMEMMILHGQAVMRGAAQSLVVVDMPFGSYESDPRQAFANASRLLIETGAGAVKIEAGTYTAEIISFLTERGIPVMGHVGLRPQSSNVTGGFKAVGRSDEEWRQVLAEAEAADRAGAFALVVEGVDELLARNITESVEAPTIGIGASSACDGQILVTPDMLGLFDWTPKFVRKFGNLRSDITSAVEAYAEAVRDRRFPGDEEVYRLRRN
ncbi:3-methyl-2-oxobutanoate hydroxymethyltransferase [Parvularcula bermudensis HTCC2503]|uniref:3-methyl-2-oxobutanoate hydroxymethyltransferase n=1 Tax=Parvularcula bermudensis (strain ATCC BAA-594 / HTCC2503 / KCTC 12087) TaxID=314260 RepID=E0TIB5_PARBH|nr:3-methyl-2-oxobutanoate hydroxymethyltransferase [Parvularcula bermudensis]ADM09699.1 3-methyl-2-oxobutanoate hydroxymethyltransferase [Parvularcula bermudensis HTCC2503]